MSVTSSLAILSMVSFVLFAVIVFFRGITFGAVLLMAVAAGALIGSQLRGHFVIGRDGLRLAFFRWAKVYLFREMRGVERYQRGMVLLFRDGTRIELEASTLAQRAALELNLNQAWNAFAWHPSTKSITTEVLETEKDWAALVRDPSALRSLSSEDEVLPAIVADVTTTTKARVGAAVVLRGMGYPKIWDLLRGVIDASVDDGIRVPLDRLRRGATDADVRTIVDAMAVADGPAPPAAPGEAQAAASTRSPPLVPFGPPSPKPPPPPSDGFPPLSR